MSKSKLIQAKHLAFWRTSEEEINEKQKLIDSITEKLSEEDIKSLDKLLSWHYSQVAAQTEFDLGI